MVIYCRCSLEIVTPPLGTHLYEELINNYAYKPPTELKGWVNISWKEAGSKPWIKYPRFYEYFQLMFNLAFLLDSNDTISIINILKKWARFRISKRWIKFAPEFYILRLLCKLFLHY